MNKNQACQPFARQAAAAPARPARDRSTRRREMAASASQFSPKVPDGGLDAACSVRGGSQAGADFLGMRRASRRRRFGPAADVDAEQPPPRQPRRPGERADRKLAAKRQIVLKISAAKRLAKARKVFDRAAVLRGRRQRISRSRRRGGDDGFRAPRAPARRAASAFAPPMWPERAE